MREKAHSVKQIVHDGLLVLGLPPPPLTHSRQEGKQNAADRSIGRKTDRGRKGICQISKNKKIKNFKSKVSTTLVGEIRVILFEIWRLSPV